MSGEALRTTDSMRNAQFLCYLVGGVLKRADLVPRKRINETGTGQPGDLGSAALR